MAERIAAPLQEALMPAALSGHCFCVFTRGNLPDALGVVGEGISCVAALVDNVAVSVENGDGKGVSPQMTPDVLDQVLIGQARHDLVEDTIVTPTLPAMVEGLSTTLPAS